MFRICMAVVLCIPGCLSQITAETCDKYKVKVVQNFDVSKYLGEWYEYQRYNAHFQPNADCVTANYSLKPNNKIKVINTCRDLTTKIKSDITGEAYPETPANNEGKLKVLFVEGRPAGDYWVIGTDYINYSVVWSCRGNSQFLWILLRNPQITDAIKKAVDDILTDAGLDKSQLRLTNNDPAACSTT